jgi:hypothetical protein
MILNCGLGSEGTSKLDIRNLVGCSVACSPPLLWGRGALVRILSPLPLLLRARRGNCLRGCKRACLFRVYVTREKPLVGILYHYRGAVCAGLSALLLISGGGSFNAVHGRSVPEDRMNFWMNCTFRVTVSLVLVLTVSVGLLLGRRRSVSCLLKTKNVSFVGR